MKKIEMVQLINELESDIHNLQFFTAKIEKRLCKVRAELFEVILLSNKDDETETKSSSK
ncbi:hypothetical protein VHA01S_054_00080 [Vibrio halioticoli NBRC 102217]|uniref:Uncharacterized protein n=1 Tax=Vibrio halioticoli NBRC 102217 TaxID=1219072 RepID=V5F5A9_9VIBR|nr:hypothetical protein [Vibrio halioticoli]GAD90714.1 hypothetical protein VHA01S_054_00080 [Vibrio halioticoli NBRC 102217]